MKTALHGSGSRHRKNGMPGSCCYIARSRCGQVKNQLQALALNQGVQRKWKLWSASARQQLENLPLLPWAHRRRTELLVLHDQLEASIGELDGAVTEQAHRRAAVQRLMTHPGVGPIAALASVLTLGPVGRFRRGKQVASYFGLIPTEHSQRRWWATVGTHQQGRKLRPVPHAGLG
jgi:transposase